MFNFVPITLKDKEGIDSIRRTAGHEQASHGFGALYMWREAMALSIHREDDWFAVRYGDKGYFFPCGSEAGKRRFVDYAASQGKTLYYLGEEDTRLLSAYFPGLYQVRPDPGASEYLYSVEEQAALAGRKFAHIRKQINRLLAEDPVGWSVVPIAEDNLEEVRRIVYAWNALHTQDNSNDYVADTAPTLEMLNVYRELGLYGLLALYRDSAVAYMFGSELTPQVFNVHSAKHAGANGGVDFFCKQQLCLRLRGRYALLNREEDLGLEGLRMRKRQSKPVRFLENWRASIFSG